MTGLRLVEEAGHAGGGVIIDVWHTERAGTTPAELARVPLDRIVGVELDDADSVVIGTLFEDTVNRRRYCGEGACDLVGDIAALRSAGWTGPWGIEILSEEHRSLDVRSAARRAFMTGQNQLERAGINGLIRAMAREAHRFLTGRRNRRTVGASELTAGPASWP
jgi:sugar phosphate isomerase/epimerase